MFNEMIVGLVTEFSGTDSTDKNGEKTVMIQCLAGIMPNRNVLAGTLARRGGYEIGKTYLFQVREIGEHIDYGTQFNFLMVQEITSPVHVVELQAKLGKPQIMSVDTPNIVKEKYERTTNAIEGMQTKQIREGVMISAYPRTSTDHQNAKVKDGKSVTTATEQQFSLSGKGSSAKEALNG